jgi:hypothetical protein
LKAFAIEERNKSKDSYDLVWTLNAYKEGPRSCVEAIARSPVIRHPGVPVAISHLKTNFQTPEHRGPSQYAIFEMSTNDDDERARLRRFAHGTLVEFFKHWQEMKLPE